MNGFQSALGMKEQWICAKTYDLIGMETWTHIVWVSWKVLLSWELATQPSISCSECLVRSDPLTPLQSKLCFPWLCSVLPCVVRRAGCLSPAYPGDRAGAGRELSFLGIYWASLYSPLLFPMALRSSWYYVDFRDKELEAYKIELIWLRLHSSEGRFWPYIYDPLIMK